MNIPNYIAIAGVAMIGYGIRSYFKANRDEVESEPVIDTDKKEFYSTTVDGREQAQLSNVSVLWTGDKIKLSDLAVNWREDVGSRKAPPIPTPNFSHKEISDFYLGYVESIKHLVGARKIVINHILSILDKEGMCPCVVRDQKDPSENYDDNTFAELSRIPLYQHTLAVAKKCITAVSDEVLIPNILIVSLGHDLGKIPMHHNKYYRTSDHPEISTMILAGISEYITLPNRRELDNIIKTHHQLSPKNKIALLLKQCDQEARKDEMGAALSPLILPTNLVDEDGMTSEEETLLVENGQPEAEETTALADKTAEIEGNHSSQSETAIQQAAVVVHEKKPAQQVSLSSQKPSAPTPIEAAKSKADVNEDKGDLYIPKRIDISTWFNSDKVLEGIREIINKTERVSSGIQWQAVTVPDGLLYVRPDGLWRVIREQFHVAAVKMGDGDESQKRDILLSVVWALSEKGITVTEGMGGNTYYFTKANVISNGGRQTSMLLIPFNISAFGVLPSHFEMQKPAILKAMVKTIRIKD